ncbi:hypothetical protein [Synechococcus sp. UW69]|uniref:hypothetical protein n=1 Tax=Synechococcus sp. UW69 TaxID=368493 RepID=UPI0010BDC30D|nr:hypothetical protein [Synechococcus sp. UW69]
MTAPSKKILLLGDSHAHVFKLVERSMSKLMISHCIVTGSSAQGAVNPHSKTNALAIFKDKLDKYANSHTHCMTMLGEVDCGYVIWFRKTKYNDSIRSQLKRSLNNYFEFLKKEVENYFEPNHILICCVVPPTIRDNTDKRFLKGARTQVTASQSERSKLTEAYNYYLKKLCTKRGYKFVNTYENLIDQVTRLPKISLLNSNPYDHHLDASKTYKYWRSSLLENL